MTFRVENVPVQGAFAVPEVIDALARLDHDPAVDVIVVARGGGSLEDLLPFSDEALVRAVSRCRTPVVSAIGHEQDSPLLDLVADARASTPTDAAKRVVPAVLEEIALVSDAVGRGRKAISRWLDREHAGLVALRSRPCFAEPARLVDARFAEVEALRHRANGQLRHRIDRSTDDLHHTLARVRTLSPLATLERGYAVLLDDEGAAVRSVAGVAPGHRLRATVADGTIAVTVHGVAPASD